MRIIEAARIRDAVKRLYIQANRELPADVTAAIRAARAHETGALARDTLDKIIQNSVCARECSLPLCQDTGIACVFVEHGEDVHIEGSLADAVNAGVRGACIEGFLRASVVGDPLRRVNSGDNTPAMLNVEFVSGGGLTITVAPKGFGSENMSRMAMLTPAAGEAGVIDFVVRAVREAGANPCPPVVVGVGLGGSFDKAALLAKKALLRPLDAPHPDPFYARLEAALLEKINTLGIGPQGFGGEVTALGVAVETMPTHIAGLPCAVNINCHAARHVREEL